MAASQTSLIRQAMSWHRPLMLVVAAMALLAVVAAAGAVVDQRTLGGQPIWMKPFKFAVSITIYGATLAWMLSLLRRAPRWGWWMGIVTTVALWVEMVLIVGQVIRGRHSHFHVATPLDTAVWTLMAVSITVLWVSNMVVAALLLRERLGDRATAAAMRLGLVLAIVGMGLAFLMTQPTPEQADTMAAGAGSDFVGAHSVGVPDGGQGLPVTGWSTTGGDMRVPHFVGIHGLQAIPLVALALVALGSRLETLRDERVRVQLVRLAAAAYAGLVALVTWQALRGKPLIHPDGATLTALALLLAAAAAGAAVIIRYGRTPPVATVPAPGDPEER